MLFLLETSESTGDPPVEIPTDWGLLSNGKRNKHERPFDKNSAACMPIGSSAAFAFAGISYRTDAGASTYPTIVGADEDIILIGDNRGQRTYGVYQQSTFPWPGGSRATDNGSIIDNIPFDQTYIVPDSNENETLSVLMPNAHTIHQFQPACHPATNSKITAWSQGPSIDIYGSNVRGAHGGSGLSGAAFAIKQGELYSNDIHHPMGVNIWAYHYYNVNCTFSWPAKQVDGYCPTGYGGYNPYLRPGALLALRSIPTMRTDAGALFARAFYRYGGYCGDDSAANKWGIWMARSKTGSAVIDFNNKWPELGGFVQNGSSPTNPWYLDMIDIFSNLWIVTNNGPYSIGGGGTPRVALSPDIGN